MQLQYIGARYVPKWYVNSVDGTADWEVNVEYEPLTWVTTQNNHLYLSKKEVPDNIGTPAQNTDYWLDMGEFTSGQTQQLQEEINSIFDMIAPEFNDLASYTAGQIVRYDDGDGYDLYIFTNNHSGAWDAGDVTQTTINSFLSSIAALTDEVSDLKIKAGFGDALFIGDSYCTLSTGYTKALPELLNDIFSFGHVYNYAIAGAGYVNGIGTSQHFGGQLQNAISGTTAEERNNISHVFVLGGQNDYAQSVSDLYTEVNSLYTNIKTSFPNAKIVALPLWRNARLSDDNSVRFPIIYYLADKHGCITDYLSWSYLINVYAQTMIDGVHPDQTTLEHLAGCVATLLRGGNVTVPFSGGIMTVNSSLGTWYGARAIFDGVNVTIRALLSVSNNISNAKLLQIEKPFRAMTYTNVLRNNNTSVQASFNNDGILVLNGTMSAGDIACIEFTYSLFTAPAREAPIS